MNDVFQHISSAQNPRFRDALKLRQRRGRDQQSRILIDGRREIELAIASGVRLDEIYIDARQLDGEATEWLSQRLSGGTQVLTLTGRLVAKLGYGDRDDQVMATADRPRRRLANLQLPADAVVAVLDRLEKPGNIGAIARSADAAGIDALILTDARTDLFNPNAIRSSRGTLFTLPIGLASTDEAIGWLRRQVMRVCVARTDAVTAYDQIDFRGGTAIVLGNESEGVSALWHDDIYTGIHLPMHGQADSLNVAVTAAVLFYEVERQRRT